MYWQAPLDNIRCYCTACGAVSVVNQGGGGGECAVLAIFRESTLAGERCDVIVKDSYNDNDDDDDDIKHDSHTSHSVRRRDVLHTHSCRALIYRSSSVDRRTNAA